MEEKASKGVAGVGASTNEKTIDLLWGNAVCRWHRTLEQGWRCRYALVGSVFTPRCHLDGGMMMLPGAYMFDVWYFGLWYLFSNGVLGHGIVGTIAIA